MCKGPDGGMAPAAAAGCHQALKAMCTQTAHGRYSKQHQGSHWQQQAGTGSRGSQWHGSAPPHSALQAPHSPACQANAPQGAVLQSCWAGPLSAGSQMPPSGPWQVAMRVAVPPPQVALQALQAVCCQYVPLQGGPLQRGQPGDASPVQSSPATGQRSALSGRLHASVHTVVQGATLALTHRRGR